MSEIYIAVRRSNDPNDELQHYGVKGMRWGVRRATKQLSKASDSKQRDKAIAKLQKHRAKASKELAKLEKKHPKLEKKVEEKIIRNETAAARLTEKAAVKRRNAYRRFITEEKSNKLIFEANKLKAQADDLMAKSKKAKAELTKNETMQKAFKKGLDEIDTALVNKGRKFING